MSLCLHWLEFYFRILVYWDNLGKLVATMKKLEIEFGKKYAALMEAPETAERSRLLVELEDRSITH